MEESKFDVDVFISYAHLDDRPLFKDEEGWVTQFHHMLDVRLGEFLGKSPQIWRDPKLQGNDIFDDEIQDHLINSATLVCILSPRYINSDWCKKELNIFLETWENNLQIKNKSRLFKVVKTEIPREDHPEPIRKLLGYEFFERDRLQGKPREFRLEIDDPKVKSQYFELVDDIAFNLKELLLMLSRDVAGVDDLSYLRVGAGKKVYLAETTADLKQERETIRRELERRGHDVFPDVNLPVVYGELKEVVEKYLSECDLSIHLLGTNYGFIPEGGQLSVEEIQLAIAKENVGKFPYHPIVWMPEQLNGQTLPKRQQEFIQSIRTDSDFLRLADLMQSPLGKLKTLIDERLSAPIQTAKAESLEEGPSQVYLICDEQDLGDIQSIDDLLFNQGFDVLKPSFEGSYTVQREAHQYNLSICDGVLIYYGNANPTWLNQKLQNLRKLPGYGREKPLTAKCIYLAPPVTSSKTSFRTHYPIEIISAMEDFSPDQLTPFVEKIKGSHG